jgi:hypothetical protein
LKFLEIGGTDTIGILKKEFPYLFQHFTKIQRSFSKIDYVEKDSHYVNKLGNKAACGFPSASIKHHSMSNFHSILRHISARCNFLMINDEL